MIKIKCQYWPLNCALVYMRDSELDYHGSCTYLSIYPDSKVHVAHMGPTWVLSAPGGPPGGPHVGPMNLAIRVTMVSGGRTLTAKSDIHSSEFCGSHGLIKYGRRDLATFRDPSPFRWCRSMVDHDDVITWKHILHYWPCVSESFGYKVYTLAKG